ncbi:MAG TPA: MarR family transcriptional regulator [Gemmatimonadales bacterium]|nr:MarR family transcriptional regulator [Gemmatimonadales bacterium]
MIQRPAPPVVADRIHSAAIHLLRRLRKQDEAIGLTAARTSALSVVVFGGPVTIGRLAEAEQVSGPTITRMLAGMERDGLLKRTRDTGDRRVIWIKPTPKGTRLLHEGRRRRVEALAHDLEALGPGDLAVLVRAAELIQRIARGAAPEPEAAPAATRSAGSVRISGARAIRRSPR